MRRLSSSAADFSLVEGLLDGIGARRKVLLMDTCESGDYEGRAAAAAEEGSRGVRARALPQAARGLSVAAAQPARAYARDRFINVDLFRRTGAILRALGSIDADPDGDGRVSVDEMRAYVSEAVSGRTAGKQHPTVDRDNLTIRFSFPLPDAGVDSAGPAAFGAYLAAVSKGGDARRLAALLDAKGSPGPRHLATALLAAAEAGREDCVRLLLSRGADPGSRDGLGASAASLALKAGLPGLALGIVEAGADMPPLLLSGAEAGLMDRLESLVRRGSRIEKADRESALWAAIRAGNLCAVQLLVDAGVGLVPDLRASDDQRPAVMARSFGFPEIADFLEAEEAACARLCEAARTGTLEQVARLIDSGARLKTFAERLPLVVAAAEGRKAVAGLLLERGAEIDAFSPMEGWTALMAAAAWGKPEMVSFLLDAGADPNLRGGKE